MLENLLKLWPWWRNGKGKIFDAKGITELPCMRCCREGREWMKPVDQFHRDNRSPTKRASMCIECKKELRHTKVCKPAWGCGKRKPKADFYKSAKSKDKYRDACKACEGKRRREKGWMWVE